MIRRDELLVSGFGSLGREDRRRDQNTITESHTCVRSQRKIQLLLTVAENLLAERVSGEKAVAARVPVSGESGILGMVENGDRDRLVADLAAQIAPASPRAPSGVAFWPS